MASSKLALFVVLNLVLLSAVHCSPKPPGTCPIDALKLSVCGNVLNLLKLKIGVPASEQCCPLLGGLADLDAAVCLCTAIKADVLGVISLDLHVDLNLLLNYCKKTCPSDFKCHL